MWSFVLFIFSNLKFSKTFILLLQFLKNTFMTNLYNPEKRSKIKPKFVYFYIILCQFFVFPKTFKITQIISSQKCWFEIDYLYAKGIQRFLVLAFWPQLIRIPLAISVSCFTLSQLHDEIPVQRPHRIFWFILRSWWCSVERPLYGSWNSARLSPVMYETYHK